MKAAIWTLVIIILFIFFITISRNNGQEQQQATQKIIQQDKDDLSYTQCLDKASRNKSEAEYQNCLTTGATEDYCVYNTKPVIGGFIMDNYKFDLQRCTQEYPGAHEIQ